jgi:polar amino acid transport system substrate-binding protein
VIARILLLLVAAPAFAQTLPSIVAKKTLVVGMYAGAPPFVVAGEGCDELGRLMGGQPTAPRKARDGRVVCGFDVELTAEAARALGVGLEIELVEKFDELLPGLRAGRYDVVASAVTRTLERAVTVAFSDPYFASGLEVRVRDGARFPTLESLRQREVTVAFKTGTTGEAFARAELAGATFVPLVDDAALLASKDDAVVIDALAARDAEVRKRGGVARVSVEERRFTSEHFALVARQGDADWLGWLNLFLKEAKSSGAFHRLAARFNPWFRAER